MTNLGEKIRARIDDPVDVTLNGTPYVEAIRKVLDLCDDIEIGVDGPNTVGRTFAFEFRTAIGKAFGIQEGGPA